MPERNALALAALLMLAVAASAQTNAPASDAPPPRAGDTVAWYTVRPGDTLIDITIHYLGSPSLWTENLRLNPQIKDVKHLKPGSRIRVIVARQLPKRNALVNRVSRRVDAKPDPQPWATAHEGDLLKENDGVRTYEKSSADLQFDDGSHLTMTENSLVFIKEMRPAQRGSNSETIEIIDGQIDLSSRPKKKATAELHLVIGGTSGESGITSERGDLRLENVTITGRSAAALDVGAGSRLIAARLRVRSTAPAGVAAVVLDALGSTIDQSEIDGGGRATGLVIGASSVQIRNTAILHAADGVVIRGAASGNVLYRDRFEDISGTAILFEPKGGARPSRNRISEAEFVSVGRPAGSTAGASPAAEGGCVPVIEGFETVPGALGSLQGRACAGTTVEVYTGSVSDRTSAKFLVSLSPADDGTFHALVEHMTGSTRALVTATDKDGNTSLFATAEPAQSSKPK